jgi:hypothetical protein
MQNPKTKGKKMKKKYEEKIKKGQKRKKNKT